MEAILGLCGGVGGAALVAFIGAYFSRRWNLPGLGREVQSQQAVLIDALQDRIAELERGRKDDAARIAELEVCQEELASVTRRLRLAESDLLELYRQKGQTPPSKTRATPGGA